MREGRAKQLKKLHEERKSSTRRAALAAIDLLEKRGRRVTVSAVAETAGISRSTLYNHPELRELVFEKRGNWHDPSLRHRDVVACLKAENRRLQAKVESQRSWIEVLNDKGPVLRNEDVSPDL